MPAIALTLNRRELRPHCAVVDPDFLHPSVLSADPWAFVKLWLRRGRHRDAEYYWDQAHELFNATLALGPSTSPITAYYSCMNAAKALLAARGISATPAHGAGGQSLPGKVALAHERTSLQGVGAIPELSQYLGFGTGAGTYLLHNLLSGLPFIHRAYTLTYRSAIDAFLPIEDATFVKHPHNDDAWFQATVPFRYAGGKLATKLPQGFEIDVGYRDRCVIRRRARFRWSPKVLGQAASIANLASYHRRIREFIHPIIANDTRWYLMRPSSVSRPHSPTICTFLALHRLSELARYEPLLLERHLDAQHGWLLVEFLHTGPVQFIYTIAAEITSAVFLIPMSLRLPHVRPA